MSDETYTEAVVALTVPATHQADATQLEAAFRASADRGRAIAAQITGDAAEAADLVQEAYLRARRQLESYKGEASLESWLLRIVVNLSLKHQRWREVRRRLGYLVPRPEPQADPEALLGREGEVLRMQQALAQLPLKQRTAFVLRHAQDLPLAEVATLMSVSESTVKTHLLRATETLRRTLRRPLETTVSRPRETP